MLQRVESSFKIIDKVLYWTVAALFGTMAVAVFLQVIFRYIFRSPLFWSEELARYLFVWSSFLGGAIAARKGSHIGLELIQNAVPGILKLILRFLASLISSLYFGIVFYFCIEMWPKMMVQKSPALGIPIAYVYLGIIVGSAVMCAWYALFAITQFVAEKEGEEK